MPKSPDALRSSLAKSAAKAAAGGSLLGSSVGPSQNMIVRTETASFGSLALFRSSPPLADGTVFACDGKLWQYDASITNADDGVNYLKPDAVAIGEPGRAKALSFGPFASIAAFRAATPPSTWTEVTIEGVGSGIYKHDAGANMVDDSKWVIRPTAVAPTENGAFFLRANVVGVGTTSPRDRLIDTVLSTCPSIVGDMWLNEDLANAGTAATWPSALGFGTALAHAGAGSHFTICSDTARGLRYISASDVADRALITSGGVTKAIYLLCQPTRSGSPQMYAHAGAAFPLWIPSGSRFNLDNGSPVVYRSGAAGTEAFVSSPTVFCGVISSNSSAGLKIGGYNSQPYSAMGRIYGAIQMLGVPSAGQDTAVVNACNAYLGGAQQTDLLLVVGNSIAAGFSTSTNLFAQHNPASPCRLPNMISKNKAVAGRTLTRVQSELATDLASFDSAGFRRKIAFLYEDTNELAVNHTGTAALLQLNWDVAAALRAAGYLVIGSTCMPSTSVTAGDETTRVATNAAKRLQWASHFDALIDFDTLNDIAKVDGIHPTSPGGYAVFAGHVRRALVQLLA